MTPSEVHGLVLAERSRQERIRKGKPLASNPSLEWPLKLAALVEEVGEVARAINDDESDECLQAELVQVCAVAWAWLESRPLVIPGQVSLL